MRLKSILAASFAALLALTGCSSDNDEAGADAPLEFPDAQSLNEHIADRFNGTAELVDEDLTVMVESKNSELQDQDRTLKVLEDVGEGARFDYDTLTITAQADSGSWGYRYDADTVDEIADADTGDGSIRRHRSLGQSRRRHQQRLLRHPHSCGPVPLGRPPDDGGAHTTTEAPGNHAGGFTHSHGPHGHIAYPTGREPE